ncbi:uncharacterized protein LOC108047260 [Drosophila rhopaloa]|uniref:Uncharacterized protein LOC108047260 n=1 Tax=Drosophila rhopaloa TaxID=1041015 RepID=A0A6P4F1G6_DRORH|nr:uncharacterized protein LOC108047260 [Drosophila rhopaloa]
MSEPNENDKMLPPITESESTCLDLGQTELDDLKDAINVSSTNISTEECTSSKEEANNSFLYKPFDYTLHGLTDFEDQTIYSVTKESLEGTDCALSFDKQKDTTEVLTKNRTITTVNAKSLRNEESVKRFGSFQLENHDATLDQEADLNDIFCSTMINPEEIDSMFAVDETEISNRGTLKTTDSHKEMYYQKNMDNPIQNHKEFKKSNAKRKCSKTNSDNDLENIDTVPRNSLKLADNGLPVPHQNGVEHLRNKFEEFEKTVEKEPNIDTLLKNKIGKFNESGQLSKETDLEVKNNLDQSADKDTDLKVLKEASDNLIFQQLDIERPKKNINELKKTTFLESPQEQIPIGQRAIDLEDGEVTGEDNDFQKIEGSQISISHQKMKPKDKDTLSNNEMCKLLESGELSEDNTSGAEHDESADLEDGEVSGEDDNVPTDVSKKEVNGMPICRFHIRNACSWGNNCRFRHPEPNNKGNYVMFEKKFLPVAPALIPRGWPAFMTPCADTHQLNQAEKMVRRPRSPAASALGLNDMDTDPYYSKDQPEVQERLPLLPTPTFIELLMMQKNYQQSVALKRSVRNTAMPSKPRPIAWESRLSSSSTSTLQESPSSSSSPEGSPPRCARHNRSTIRTTTTASSSHLHSLKRQRSPSPPRFSIRGPRTPSRSPHTRSSVSTRPEPKRQRPDSSDSSESSSYESTTESSDDASSSSDSDTRGTSSRRTGKKNKTSSRAKKLKRYSSHTQASSSKYPKKHISKRRSPQTSSESSTKTPARNPPKLIPLAPKKGHSAEDNSYSAKKKQSRQKYLLLQLLRVEEQIAKKKQQRLKALKRSTN